ncbi:hypothetical protein [Micromonospora sp. RP3T]|uniref:hypothetical protein n=1 Tax=Micromonospora sp. RP3T TaxID=2135446 RepID=UPI0011B27B8A|nr:hypothetical protein [Micromonospora sp. RP3T]
MTAAGLVVTTKPTDDAGARTYDQFDWQAAMASADGLRLYLDNLSENGVLAPRDCRILCEYHEDWAALDEEDAELVSAKHPGTSYGAYTTMNALVNEGGIGHLFERWKSMDGKPACRLVTTGGLAPGPAQGLLAAAEAMRAQRLAGSPLDTDGEHAEIVTNFAREVFKRQAKSKREGTSPAPEPNGEDRDEVARFLSGLTLQCSQPARTYIAYAAPSMYVAPVLIRLGIQVSADSIWEAVLSLFRARMRAAGPRPTGALPEVISVRADSQTPTAAEAERRLADRIVTLADIDVAIRTAVAYPDGYRPLARLPRSTRLAVKMSVGGCSDNSIERAEQLRIDYQDYWRSKTNDEPTSRVEQSRLRRLLLKVSDAATSSSRTSNGAWGGRFWEEFQDRLSKLPVEALPGELDEDLLLGGAADLANRCQIWFSNSFDVEEEIARLRARRGAA